MNPKTQKGNATTEKPETKPLTEFSIPMRASIEDIMRSLKILSDKGDNVRFRDISGMFGPKKSDRNLLSNSLSAGDAFDLIKPHRGKARYVLSQFGTEFLSVPEEQERKAMLLPKFLRFKGYRNILVQMKNSPDKSLKKEVVTDAWMGVKKKPLNTRRLYTTTFASVGKWCGAITDTGQTCSLTPEGETTLNQILKGEEPTVLTIPPHVPPTPTPPISTTTLTSYNCPHCGKSEIGIENEELLNTLPSNGAHILIVKTTFYCRGCSRNFSVIGQRLVGSIS
jgi:hypothetical protein